MALFPGRSPKTGLGGGVPVDPPDYEDDLTPEPEEDLRGSTQNDPVISSPDYHYKLVLSNNGMILKDLKTRDAGVVYSLTQIVAVDIDPPKAAEPEYVPATKTWVQQEHGATVSVMANCGTARFQHVDLNDHTLETVARWLQ